MLSRESSAEPGRWSNDRTPYLREFMDAFLDPEISDVVGVFGSQLGKTEALNNVLGYFIHRDPCPILFVQPTLALASAWSKLRLVPMLRDTPSLRSIVGDPLAKTTGQEILEKSYPGGQLAIAGANAPGGLAGRPRRVVLGDELDRWPASAGAEGSPVELARKRTTTYWNRVHGWISSPGTAGQSTIWPLWENSDQRRYWVNCPECQHAQTLVWAQVRWDETLDDLRAPASAAYRCEACDAAWDDATRFEAVLGGRWVKGRESGTVAGFHLSALYSPWLSLEELVREWLQAQGNPEALKVFVNTRLAELWEEARHDVDTEELLARREEYGPKAPAGVLLVTAGVDVQDDRLEIEFVGWGKDGQSWSLDYRVVHGDPEALLDFDPKDPHADRRLDDELGRMFESESGVRFPVSATCVDSGGHHTQAVYRYAKARARRRVYATKGRAGEGYPLWPLRSKKTSKGSAGRVAVHLIGVDTGKSQLFHRLAVKEPERPGYCHFPDRAAYDLEYFSQLTGEAPAPIKYVRGRKTPRVWKQIYPRVEALDCRVYASAALASLSPNWDRIAKVVEKRSGSAPAEATPAEPDPVIEEQSAPEPDAPAPSRPGRRVHRHRPRRGGFVTSWRG